MSKLEVIMTDTSANLFITVSPKLVPLNRAISPCYNVLFQRGQCSSMKIVKSKVCIVLVNGAMARNVMPSCRPGHLDCHSSSALQRPGKHDFC